MWMDGAGRYAWKLKVLLEVLDWLEKDSQSEMSIPLSGGGSRQDSLPRSSETFSSAFRDNRESTPVEVQKGGECGV